MSEEKLLSCPFHEYESELSIRRNSVLTSTFFFVLCECGTRGPHAGTEEEAIKAWNTRTDRKASSAEYDELIKDVEIYETEVSKVYMHITNGQLSKLNTDSVHIITAHDEECNKARREACAKISEKAQGEYWFTADNKILYENTEVIRKDDLESIIKEVAG